MDLGFDFGDLGFSLDFDDLAAMSFEDSEEEGDELEGQLWSRPVVRAPKLVAYEHALDMAREMVIDNQTETFAFVSGNFVFGDLLEALVDERKLGIRKLGIHTLSLNEDNIDSIRNVLEMTPVEELDVILSNYWYAHELKTGMVAYLFDQFDLENLELRVAFAGTHSKVVTIETPRGNVLTMHGSANLRSSGNVEQLHISPRPRAVRLLRGDEQAHPGRLRCAQPGQPQAQENREEVGAMAGNDRYAANDQRGSKRRASGDSARDRRVRRAETRRDNSGRTASASRADVYDDMPF